jgi:LysM repeat protein
MYTWLVRAAILFALAPTASAQRRTWTVRAGEALGVIAARFGVSVSELREWNALDGDLIRIGQELVISGEARPASPEHVVAEGETLSGIAVRFGVTVEDLLSWNEGLEPDSVRVGQRLVVGVSRHRIEHEVRAGESLSRVAERYGVPVRDLRTWNPRLRERILVGQKLVVFSDKPESRSASVGLPHGGSLVEGEQLPRHAGYFIRDRSRAFATRETCDAIIEAFDAVRERDPDAPKLRIHDLSYRAGGPISDHRSHQSGRDADITYYLRRGCTEDGCPMRRIGPEDLDVERTWALLHHWLERDQAQAVFIDYALQAPLYRYARSRGATREELHRWFQYPRGTGYPLGVIRHFPLHRDHMHVRFNCPEGDEDCR